MKPRRGFKLMAKKHSAARVNRVAIAHLCGKRRRQLRQDDEKGAASAGEETARTEGAKLPLITPPTMNMTDSIRGFRQTFQSTSQLICSSEHRSEYATWLNIHSRKFPASFRNVAMAQSFSLRATTIGEAP